MRQCAKFTRDNNEINNFLSTSAHLHTGHRKIYCTTFVFYCHFLFNFQKQKLFTTPFPRSFRKTSKTVWETSSSDFFCADDFQTLGHGKIKTNVQKSHEQVMGLRYLNAVTLWAGWSYRVDGFFRSRRMRNHQLIQP